jgi:hypothetical protein
MRGFASVHDQRSPEEVQQVLAWYKIRDLLVGHNFEAQNVKKALELAALSHHVEAVWLTRLFNGHAAESVEQARQVFLGCKSDEKAVFFASFFDDEQDDEEFMSLLSREAHKGYAFAQGMMAGNSSGEEGFEWAKKSAVQGERDGFFWLGHYSVVGGNGTERAKQCTLIAAELGSGHAIISVAQTLDKADPQRFVWWRRGLAFSERYDFMAGGGIAAVVFMIGRLLKGNVDQKNGVIFGKLHVTRAWLALAEAALCFHDLQLQACRNAVDCWTRVGLRYGVVRDIRNLIGKMIWETREEAKYLFVKIKKI